MKTLILSGGGYNGIMHIGCAKCLEETGCLQTMNTVIGTSAGSIIALMLAMNYATYEITQLVHKHLVHDDASDDSIDPCEVFAICDTYGISNGEKLMGLVKEILIGKNINASITFMELGKRFGKNLVVCGANLTRRRSEYFCIDATPDMSVALAVRISCSVPILFTPVTHDECLYVDGGIYAHFPYEYTCDTNMQLSGVDEKDTIGVNILVAKCEITSLSSYIVELLNSVMDRALQTEKITSLPFVCNLKQSTSLSFDLLQLGVSPEKIDTLIEEGYVSMKTFMKERERRTTDVANALLGETVQLGREVINGATAFVKSDFSVRLDEQDSREG